MSIITDQQLNNNCLHVYTQFQFLYPETFAAMELFYLFGFRWIELYELSRWSQLDQLNWIVDTAKDSENRIIKKADCSIQWNAIISGSELILRQFGYMSMRRYYKRYTTIKTLKKGGKYISLHSFRYNRAKQLHLEGKTDIEIQQFFGEKELINMRFYIYGILEDDN